MAVNPCGCGLTGSVTLDALGNAVSWDFTDGIHTLTQDNSTASFDPIYLFSNSSSPLFRHWHVQITGQDVRILSEFDGSYGDAEDSVVVLGQAFMNERDSPVIGVAE
jgi:hypothetical protein